MANAVLCTPECKNNDRELRGNPKTKVTFCNLCMKGFHDECINLPTNDDSPPSFWCCPKCRQMPGNVETLLAKVCIVVDKMEEINRSHEESIRLFENVKQECEALRNENRSLKKNLNELSEKLDAAANIDVPSLLIGDSLIKEVDETKLIDTQVKSIPGAKASDILKKFDEIDEDRFREVFICTGTNDCSDNDSKVEDVASVIKDIVSKAKSRVSDPKNIKISSVPPRSDSNMSQEKVERLNASIVTIAEDSGITYVDNDRTFKLADGTPNDGYLQADGIHLTNKGINRLARNMKLKLLSNVTNVCKAHTIKNKLAKKTSAPKSDDNSDNNNWNLVQRRSRSSRQRLSPKRGNKMNQENSASCWFCGETNHVSRNCRHGQEIKCHRCEGAGHKEKVCVW